jgi:hypothetical protein
MTTKTWGPFNGRQLTTIIVALVIGVVMVPTGAWAVVTLKNVVINDPSGTNRALVDGAGSLQTADAPATEFLSERAFFTGTSADQTVVTPRTGKALVVKTIQVNTMINPAPGPNEYIVFFVGNSSCTQAGRSNPVVTPAGLGVTVLPFDPGLAVPAGDVLCGRSNDTSATGLKFGVSVYGITEPSAAVPSPG